MKSLILSFVLLSSLPAFAATASRSHQAQPQSQQPSNGASGSDTTQTMNQAAKDGAATTKKGGSTMATGEETTENGGTGVMPTGDTAGSAKKELRNGTTSTGGTGTTVDQAGQGTRSNTTGTGSVGHDTRTRPAAKKKSN